MTKQMEKSKQELKDFPRYSEADAVRSAIINHLKAKGFLDKFFNPLP